MKLVMYTILDGEMKDYRKGQTVGVTVALGDNADKNKNILWEAITAINDAKKYGKTSAENNMFIKHDSERT